MRVLIQSVVIVIVMMMMMGELHPVPTRRDFASAHCGLVIRPMAIG
jgi:hypothetical protein